MTTVVKYKELILPSGSYPYRLRRSRRAKRLRLKIQWPSRIEVVVPRWVTLQAAEQFVQSRQQWLAQILAKHWQLAAQLPHRTFKSGATLPLLGQTVTLQVNRVTSPHSHCRYVHPWLWVSLSSAHAVRTIIEQWYRSYARQYFAEQAAARAGQLQLTFQSVRIGNQKTQWGSASPAGQLSFNWRLLLGPAPVAAYVVAHEVAHLMHRDHSSAFWQVVAELDPAFQEHRVWLKERGYSLQL